MDAIEYECERREQRMEFESRIRRVIETREGPFLAEEIRSGLPLGDLLDAREVGTIMRSLHRQGIIEPCGFAPAITSNGSPKTLWRRKQNERNHV